MIAKKSELLKLEEGDHHIKIRRNIGLKLAEYNAIQVQKSSMLFIFHKYSRSNMFNLVDEILDQGGSACIVNIKDDYNCISKTLSKEFVLIIKELEQTIDKAKVQKRQKKSLEQVEIFLRRLASFYTMLDDSMIETIQNLIDIGLTIFLKDQLTIPINFIKNKDV